MARPPNIPALTGLRFVAASVVVLYHLGAVVAALPAPLSRVAHAGYAAVTLFYVLSGFVLTLSFEAFTTRWLGQRACVTAGPDTVVAARVEAVIPSGRITGERLDLASAQQLETVLRNLPVGPCGP